MEREGSVARRLAALWRETAKPWVAVVDSGPLYDPITRLLEEEGVPVLRTADRAMRLLAVWGVRLSKMKRLRGDHPSEL